MIKEQLGAAMEQLAPTEGRELGKLSSRDDLSDAIPDFKKTIVEKFTTRNQHLDGNNHPETGVPFKRKEVETGNGETVEGVFPEFNRCFEAQLPDEMLQGSDKVQFDECNQQLKSWTEQNPEEASKVFNQEQLEDIEAGKTPEGYTWHHAEDKGKMELVDSETHAQTGHTGGKSIWGGGSENR